MTPASPLADTAGLLLVAALIAGGGWLYQRWDRRETARRHDALTVALLGDPTDQTLDLQWANNKETA